MWIARDKYGEFKLYLRKPIKRVNEGIWFAYELIKDGNTYIVTEKKQGPPRSWEEFCKNFPIQNGEAYIDYCNGLDPIVEVSKSLGGKRNSRFWLISIEEAEAFLALIQLRQLRKAWVGDWKQPSSRTYIAVIAYNVNDKEVVVEAGNYWSNMALSFPTQEMAEDFLGCFRDLCEKAKILL